METLRKEPIMNESNFDGHLLALLEEAHEETWFSTQGLQSISSPPRASTSRGPTATLLPSTAPSPPPPLPSSHLPTASSL